MLPIFLRNILGALVSPSRCAACKTRVSLAVAFCTSCAASIELDPTTQGETLAAFLYGGPVARAITLFKFKGETALARPLAHVMLPKARPLAHAGLDCVVPVPLHYAKLVARGYNPSALLAGIIAEAVGIAYAPRALLRVRDTRPQVGLFRAEREANVHSAFAARDASFIKGKRVLLIDDVVTTGSTLAASRHALSEAGALSVVALCLARAESITLHASGGLDGSQTSTKRT